ncbi:hypothetical protein [Streptosporangium jomthongense]|uniref:UTRA domain-containing protein n=1 Tax=Streptosporangium jomthongense TaxID=1193683 RepID=A0ABV8FDL2_9ACTN
MKYTPTPGYDTGAVRYVTETTTPTLTTEGRPALTRDAVLYDGTRTPIAVIRSVLHSRVRLSDYYEMP